MDWLCLPRFDSCCWLRGATQTLEALMRRGRQDEASAGRDWLLRSAAGDPGDLQIYQLQRACSRSLRRPLAAAGQRLGEVAGGG